MIAPEGFKDWCIDEFKKWFKHFTSREYDACNNIADNHINLCRQILKDQLWLNHLEENNLAYITGVLFSGLNEFVQLAVLTRDQKWHLDTKRTEHVWLLMWNCIERFEFCSTYFKTADFTWIINVIEELREDFIAHFGHGLYSSPEILIKKEICSICNIDTRACEHIKGVLYNGKMCYGLPQDFKILTSSIVTVPRDPRCRFWPWNIKGNKWAGAMMTFFKIDDWLIDTESNTKK